MLLLFAFTKLILAAMKKKISTAKLEWMDLDNLPISITRPAYL